MAKSVIAAAVLLCGNFALASNHDTDHSGEDGEEHDADVDDDHVLLMKNEDDLALVITCLKFCFQECLERCEKR